MRGGALRVQLAGAACINTVVAAVEQVFPESPALLPARTNNLFVSALTGFMGALPERSGRGILSQGPPTP